MVSWEKQMLNKYLYLLNIQIGQYKSNQFYGSRHCISVLSYAVFQFHSKICGSEFCLALSCITRSLAFALGLILISHDQMPVLLQASVHTQISLLKMRI